MNNKNYKVHFSIKGGYRSTLDVQAGNITRARELASKIMPNSKIFNAVKV